MRCSQAMQAKALLRSGLLATRQRRGRDELDAAEAALAAHGVAAWRQCEVVAAYASIPGEPPMRRLIDDLSDAGVRVLLPIVTGDHLEWAPYDGWPRLATSARGLLEPPDSARNTSDLGAADVLVVPALAVDRRGYRLGRGGGYYDRLLAQVSTPAVAVVFEDEVLDELPTEEHDRPVSGVLTPSRLLRLPALDA